MEIIKRKLLSILLIFSLILSGFTLSTRKAEANTIALGFGAVALSYILASGLSVSLSQNNTTGSTESALESLYGEYCIENQKAQDIMIGTILEGVSVSGNAISLTHNSAELLRNFVEWLHSKIEASDSLTFTQSNTYFTSAEGDTYSIIDPNYLFLVNTASLYQNLDNPVKFTGKGIDIKENFGDILFQYSMPNGVTTNKSFTINGKTFEFDIEVKNNFTASVNYIFSVDGVEVFNESLSNFYNSDRKNSLYVYYTLIFYKLNSTDTDYGLSLCSYRLSNDKYGSSANTISYDGLYGGVEYKKSGTTGSTSSISDGVIPNTTNTILNPTTNTYTGPDVIPTYPMEDGQTIYYPEEQEVTDGGILSGGISGSLNPSFDDKKTPTTTIPFPAVNSPAWTGTLTQTDVATGEITSTTDIAVTPNISSIDLPNSDSDFVLKGLSEKFPFSIPWDIYRFYQVLNVDAEAPHLQGTIDLHIVDWNIDMNLSQFNDIAKIFRNLVFFSFLIGLILITRNQIRG